MAESCGLSFIPELHSTIVFAASTQVDEGPAARERSAGQRLNKSSLLASFAFRPPPRNKNLLSIKDAGYAGKQCSTTIAFEEPV